MKEANSSLIPVVTMVTTPATHFSNKLVHTYNIQEASREAINAAFSREGRQSSLSVDTSIYCQRFVYYLCSSVS